VALTDEQNLEELRTWRDNLIAALKTPETVSAFGGMPDHSGGNSIGRMSGRAQLLRELEIVEAKIDEVQGREPYMREARGVT